MREKAFARNHFALSNDLSLGFAFAIFMLFVASGGLLWYFGLNYEGVSGSALSKIHPATYLIVLIFLLASARARNPIELWVSLAQRRPACLLMIGATVLRFLQIAWQGAPGLAGSVDTFILAALVVMLLALCDLAAYQRIELIIHVSMIANALLGLLEFATKHFYFPYRFDGTLFLYDLRPTSLQGHPLGNAAITAVYILMLLSGGSALSTRIRILVIGLQLAALVAFGGRAAFITVLILGSLQCLRLAHRALRSGCVSLVGMAIVITFITLAPLIMGGLYASGFFDSLLTRFESDNGSANTRLEMFNLLSQLSIRDLLIGPDVGVIESLRRIEGLEQGIENPIIRSVVYQGALTTLLMIVVLSFFFFELTKWSRSGLALPLLGFIVILNSFESIASKTTMLAKFAIMAVIFFRRSSVVSGYGKTVIPSAAITAGSRAWRLSSMSPIPSNKFQKAQPKPRSSADWRTSRT